MTLKTTKEQRDALLIFIDDPDVTVYNTVTLYNSVVRDLCHDADMARKLEKEVARLDAGWTEAIEVSNAFYAQTCKLQKEIADLRAKLVEKDSSIGHQAMTTLKTTKEQHDNWRHYSAEKLRLMLGKEDIDNLCHDADRARELGEENADLHANLDRYTRIAESGKSYGDDLDNIERIGELELEATQDALDIERALSGQRLLYNRPLAIRVADLRAKLKEQQAASNNLNERLGNCKQSAKEGWRYAYELEQELKKLKETSMKIFKCEAQCDTMYFKAKDVNAAGVRLIKVTGEQIPEELLTWTEVEEVPDGEEAL